ncbi:MAG: GGDEF domain-containing protein [Proteobacteria bacterium]|nr:GGDEF domain-containing protein [Pseudomonadota bacterium]HQR04030.1 GGDEF domain-containing protein [Rhodocyclaceae bacterium]
MELIDPRTFLLVANLLGMLFALVLWVQARSFPADIHGLRHWALAIALISAASGLASLRGIVHDGLAIIASNGFSLGGEFLLVVGLQRYRGMTPHWRPVLDIMGATLLLIVWLTYGVPNYPGRIFLMCLAHIGFFTVGSWLAWGARPSGFGNRFLGTVFFLGVLVALWRIATLSSGLEQGEHVEHNLVQQVYLGMFSLGALALAIGFILLTGEGLRQQLEFLAAHDPMTGAFNRRAFFARASVEWARAARSGRPLAVLVADIDFFKKINDAHGHHVGDEVIKDFARRVGELLRIPDLLARFGGEEFVILLPDTGAEDARLVAERIRREIAESSARTTAGTARQPGYTVSIGLATACAKGTALPAPEALIATADAALYRAKQGGRNRVEGI